MKRLKQFLKWMYGYKFVYLISIFLLIALQYLRTLSPLFITHIIDNILKGGTSSRLPDFITGLFSGDTVKDQLLVVALIYVLFTLFRVMFMFIKNLISFLILKSLLLDLL